MDEARHLLQEPEGVGLDRRPRVEQVVVDDEPLRTVQTAVVRRVHAGPMRAGLRQAVHRHHVHEARVVRVGGELRHAHVHLRVEDLQAGVQDRETVVHLVEAVRAAHAAGVGAEAHHLHRGAYDMIY